MQNSEPLNRGLWSLAWPLMVSVGLGFALNFADSFFLSRVSDEAAAGVGALLPLLLLSMVTQVAVGQAGASVASQFLGAGRHDRLPQTYGAMLLLHLGVGVLMSVFFGALSSVIPGWVGLSGASREHAANYLSWIGPTQFVRGVQVAYSNIFNSRGATRWNLCEAVLTNVVNIVLNTTALHWAAGDAWLGVAGVAWATVLASCCGLLLQVFIAHRVLRVHVAGPTSLATLVAALRPVLRIGAPSAGEPISYQGMQFVVTRFIATLGTSALAARIYSLNFLWLSVVWSLALGIATQILVARHVGGARFDRADAELRKGLRVAMLGALVITAGLLYFRPTLISLLTHNPAILDQTRLVFWIALLVEPARAANIVAGGCLRASGDARYASLVGILFMWGLGVPACYLLGFGLKLGLAGVWLGFALDEGVRGWINYRRWRSRRWERYTVMRVESPPAGA